ncbi:phosphoglucomutase/phosphomannomutase family protein [Taibaiella lutea]|uniref:Phosphoglucomutase/phosphomannomutase family protein n=1 Tax=Taibaiella lutea TaxID=2608001 RepID=A0A5M6CDX6_9BACT|nr:phosphoglucomutase/phosphomannomutase family protein [Taibaiella lutea]KAA5533257.1 phosphoglucomutase/phosphomannomutase family protein [Taibaiella lutea]
MDIIKFGTDGWRAIIAKDFTVYNVARVAKALADWLNQSGKNAKVVIGHDCRFAGALFAETTANVLCANGVKVALAKGFVSTPMVSLGVKELAAQQGVVITASHNPPAYNGFKLKGPHGGPTNPKDITAVEALIPETVEISDTTLDQWQEKGMLEYIDLEKMYIDYLHTKFNLEKLNNAPYKLAYDAMYGAGQNVIRKTLPAAVLLHCDYNPSFKDTPPEPIHKNLLELSKVMATTPELKVGLATDGDADRIGLYDEDGNFVDAHHIILLLIQYLHKYKKLNGKVVIAFSVTDRVKKMCEQYGLEVQVTPIGFKYISEIMITEDVLLGGEESGGIAIKGHIPERDGIFDGLIIYEYMMETGKTLKELCEEIYEVVGRFSYERNDLNLLDEQKQRIMKEAADGVYTEFGKYKVVKVENIDGIKYHFEDGGWTMLRASGTEPVLRIYAEGNSHEEALDILEQVKKRVL